MKKYFGLIIIFISVSYSFGQSYLLKGKVVDVETNEPLPYSTIEINSLRTGTIANIIVPKNRANGLVKKSFNFNTRYDKTNPTQILA
jgi:hypothetical protein